MSEVKDNFIKILENLPYDIDKAALEKSTGAILSDVVTRYVDEYGTDNLSDLDIECVESLTNRKISRNDEAEQQKEND